MRISDWSSDVCSSDLPPPHCRTRGACSPGRKHAVSLSLAKARDVLMGALFADTAAAEKPRARFGLDMLSDWLPYRVFDESAGLHRNARSKGFILEVRSEEHTSELQSLMRISYAVFCLKKKKEAH